MAAQRRVPAVDRRQSGARRSRPQARPATGRRRWIGGRLSGMTRSCHCALADAIQPAMPREPSTAIVTGASKRVGRVIAEALLADGWTVVAHVHHDGDEVPEGAVEVAADLADRRLRRSGFSPRPRGCRRCGCWSTMPPASRPTSLGSFDAREFDAHMAVNVRAPILLTEAIGRPARWRRRLVVNLLDAKLAAPNPDFLSYTLSKQALAGFTELAARGARGQGHSGQWHRPGADAALAGPERGEFRGHAARSTRLRAASSPAMSWRRCAI